MDIQSPTNPTIATNQSASAQGNAASKALSSDFETFLVMLTTQMQNQDPLNPMESQDFAVQLATFSGVEQQVKTNELLEGLAGGLGASGMAEFAGWIGMDARVTGPAVFDGSPVSLSIQPEPGAEQAVLVVRNATGQVVSREDIPLGADTVDWVGRGAGGQPLFPDQYTFELESISGGEIVATTDVSHYARVTEVRVGPEGSEIMLASGRLVSGTDVTALRAPGL